MMFDDLNGSLNGNSSSARVINQSIKVFRFLGQFINDNNNNDYYYYFKYPTRSHGWF